MNEFVSTIRHRAAEALRTTFRQEATPGTDPIVELIGFLLDEAIGSDSLPASFTLSPEKWTTWNELVLLYEADVIQAMSSVLNHEQMELPIETVAMRAWAAWLVQSTLDQIDME